MSRLGAFRPVEVPAAKNQEVVESLSDDPDDCIALIQSWMGRRSSGENLSAIRLDDVDRALKLAPGSARLHIQVAAERWGYIVDREGKDTILFKKKSTRA